MDSYNHPRFVVAIGASAGGLNYVIELIAQLNGDIDAAIFIVLHIAQTNYLNLVLERLQNNTSLNCKIAINNDLIQRGALYLAPPDYHLIVKQGKIILGEGSHENRWRPSIDVLMRSAAVAYDNHSIGIILSGLMTDGISGMIAIKKCGGTCIVQHPDEAEYPDMPISVLENMDVDYIVPLNQMGPLIIEKLKNGNSEHHQIPVETRIEADIAERVASEIENVSEIGIKSNYSCPDCGGGLWEVIGENIIRYRCHTGHVFTRDELLIKQNEALENTLWIALRMLEERSNLLKKMYREELGKGLMRNAGNKKERYESLDIHINRLKEILFESKKF